MPKDPNRDTVPPPVPLHRTRPGIGERALQRLPPPGTTEESDREVFLRALAEQENRLAERFDVKPLPPASENPDDACLEATRRRAELAEAELAELKRQRRVESESRLPGPYQSPIEVVPVSIPQTAKVVHDEESDADSVASLRRAKARLYLAVAAFITAVLIPFGGWVISMRDAENSRVKSERAAVIAEFAKTLAEQAKEQAGVGEKKNAADDKAFRQYRSNMREKDRLNGTEYPAVDGDPAPDDLKPMTPLCPPGKVCRGPQLVLLRPP